MLERHSRLKQGHAQNVEQRYHQQAISARIAEMICGYSSQQQLNVQSVELKFQLIQSSVHLVVRK